LLENFSQSQISDRRQEHRLLGRRDKRRLGTFTVKYFQQFAGALVVAGGFVILCIIDCRHSNMLLACITVASGCHGLQYLGVMAMPLQLCRRNAAGVGAMSLVIANIVKITASFAVYHISQLVSRIISSAYTSCLLDHCVCIVNCRHLNDTGGIMFSGCLHPEVCGHIIKNGLREFKQI